MSDLFLAVGVGVWTMVSILLGWAMARASQEAGDDE